MLKSGFCCVKMKMKMDTSASASASAGGRRRPNRNESAVSRAVSSVFSLVRLAEFEILFVLFFVIAFLIFKDLTSRPEYNQILVKKPGGDPVWPY